MSDNQSQSEPSMEEILASIRRIISEDEAEGDARPGEAAAGGAAAQEGTAADAPAAYAPAAEAPAPEAAPADSGAGGEDDDVLELTEADAIEDEADSGDVLDLAPAEPAIEEPAAAAPPTAAAEAAVAAHEVEGEPEPEFAAESAPEFEAPFAGAAQDQRVEDASWEEPAPEPAEESQPLSADGLVSAATAAAATAALSQVTRRRKVPDAVDSPDGGETLHAFAARLMEPHLKEWLDQNLERLVERVVREEVRRLARRAEDD